MTIDVKVPLLPESVADATIATWHKKVGDAVKRDENLVDLETDKVMLEVPSPAEGILKEIIKLQGDTVQADTVIARIEPGAVAAHIESKPKEDTAPAKDTQSTTAAGPSARRAAREHEIDLSQVKGTGKSGRIVKENILEAAKEASKPAPSEGTSTVSFAEGEILGERLEKRVPMTRMRARIAERLLEVKQQTAMLTTFNEINMHQVMQLRNVYKDKFEKTHRVKLGFMSFFVKAVVEALKRFPAVNASIDGQDIIYHGFFDVGVAVSTDRGLVVPVLRNADQMSMAEVEASIAAYASKARDGKLSLEEMQGGTFTITNGGVFGSLLSTPILNAPQSAILGMHKIDQRPVVENGQIVIRPMMYVALSYDHRIIDGKDSVTFLVTIKELLEDPARLLLEI